MIAAFRRLALPLGLVLPIVAALPAAADTIYECHIAQNADNGNWIPDTIVVVQKDGEPTATVFDALIKRFNGSPMVAKIDTDNTKRVTYSWEVKVKSVTNQPSRMGFRLTVMKADLSASVTARPLRYAQDFAARGKCQKAKKK